MSRNSKWGVGPRAAVRAAVEPAGSRGSAMGLATPGLATGSEAHPPPSSSQMFNCITELVLRAKKDNLAKQQQQQQNDVVKLTKNSKRKKRCC